MDRISCMQALVAVIETGGFSAAARRLGVSKSLVSKQVSQLENQLGARLLQRTTRRVSPTSSGQAYYDRACALLDDLAALEESVSNSQTRLLGCIRIAAPITFAELYLVEALTKFGVAHPQLRFDLHLNDRLVDLIEAGLDVAIRIGELADSSLVARRLAEVRFVLCAAPGYLADKPPIARPEDLHGHACVLDHNPAAPDRWRFQRDGQALTLALEHRFSVNSARAVCDLLLAGQGVGICPSFMVAEHLAAGRLRLLLPEYEREPIGLYAVYPHRRHLSARTRELIGFLVDHFAADFGWDP